MPLPLDEAISRAGASAELVVVVSRCREPLQPLLRLLPAVLGGGGGAVRVVVYERCVAGAHLSELPALDVRDRLFGVRRVVFSEAGSAQAARAAHAAAAPAAALTLYVRPRLLAALAPSLPSAPAPAPGRTGDAHQRLMAQLLPRWASVPPREAWTDAHSEAATLARCVGDAVGAGGAFELRDARNASHRAARARRRRDQLARAARRGAAARVRRAIAAAGAGRDGVGGIGGGGGLLRRDQRRRRGRLRAARLEGELGERRAPDPRDGRLRRPLRRVRWLPVRHVLRRE